MEFFVCFLKAFCLNNVCLLLQLIVCLFSCAGCGIHYTTVQVTLVITVLSATVTPYS